MCHVTILYSLSENGRRSMLRSHHATAKATATQEMKVDPRDPAFDRLVDEAWINSDGNAIIDITTAAPVYSGRTIYKKVDIAILLAPFDATVKDGKTIVDRIDAALDAFAQARRKELDDLKKDVASCLSQPAQWFREDVECMARCSVTYSAISSTVDNILRRIEKSVSLGLAQECDFPGLDILRKVESSGKENRKAASMAVQKMYKKNQEETQRKEAERKANKEADLAILRGWIFANLDTKDHVRLAMEEDLSKFDWVKHGFDKMLGSLTRFLVEASGLDPKQIVVLDDDAVADKGKTDEIDADLIFLYRHLARALRKTLADPRTSEDGKANLIRHFQAAVELNEEDQVVVVRFPRAGAAVYLDSAGVVPIPYSAPVGS